MDFAHGTPAGRRCPPPGSRADRFREDPWETALTEYKELHLDGKEPKSLTNGP